MYYRLRESIALRSWKFVSRAYYRKNEPYAKGLSKGEFDFLLLCDGEHDIPESSLTKALELKGFIEKCSQGEHPCEWSGHKSYGHRYFPKMNFMITGKCNYNCLHCFNAADNAPIMTEWSYEDATDLLKQAKECGIYAFTVTGGEPMLHPRFMDIVREIYRQGMFLEELNTNGYFIDQKVLDELAETGCDPLIKISFDGLGCHDWMRDRKGAEERTLAAIRLCIDNGFKVMAQTQVHRRSLHTIFPTVKKLDSMGVSATRLIRTAEAPRWSNNAPDSCLGIEEYYAEMLDFAEKYKNSGMNMNVMIWQFMDIYPLSKSYRLKAVLCPDGEYKATDPVCKGNRGMIGVTSGKDVVPCLQMSGYYEEHGIHLGNLGETSLKELLTGSEFLSEVCTNLHKFRKSNKKCDECRYFRWCNGGCPALGLLFTGDRMGSDLSKCLFYENGWYDKCVSSMDGWRNLTEIESFKKTYMGIGLNPPT